MPMLFFNSTTAKMTSVQNKGLQFVICIKDNKMYAYKIDENPYFLEEDYSLIKCFLVKSGKPDFKKEIEIYGKDLVSAD
jgi:hypothetical protein